SQRLKGCFTYPELEAFLHQMIHQVCAKIQERKESAGSDSIVDYISQYVEEHYAKEVYLDDLAEKLKMSSGYLSVYFKNKTGNNFIDYLNGFRIAKAQELLASTDWRVKEIAERCGYQNINSFNRMF